MDRKKKVYEGMKLAIMLVREVYKIDRSQGDRSICKSDMPTVTFFLCLRCTNYLSYPCMCGIKYTTTIYN